MLYEYAFLVIIFTVIIFFAKGSEKVRIWEDKQGIISDIKTQCYLTTRPLHTKTPSPQPLLFL